MKTYFLAAALISISFGQLSAQKAKLTSSNVGLRYELYPEFGG